MMGSRPYGPNASMS